MKASQLLGTLTLLGRLSLFKLNKRDAACGKEEVTFTLDDGNCTFFDGTTRTVSCALDCTLPPDNQSNENGSFCHRQFARWITDPEEAIGLTPRAWHPSNAPCIRNAAAAPEGVSCSSCYGENSTYVIRLNDGPLTTAETCNGEDDDCNGEIDDVPDHDSDGYICDDCQPNNASVPGNPINAEMCELPCEDQNCIDDEEYACQQVLGFGPQCDGIWQWCGGGPNGCCADGGVCYPSSPVIIDVNGDGFALTNAANGVDFDMNGDGTGERLGWTTVGSDDAWLVLDRDGNGTIDNGKELFGNYTDQPRPTTIETNGFSALSVFDNVSNGGDADDEITKNDAIFDSLRLWRDSNHNGISDTNELKTLKQVGLRSIELDYRISRKIDAHGNKFKYRAKVRDENGAQLGRWAYDVFLVRQ